MKPRLTISQLSMLQRLQEGPLSTREIAEGTWRRAGAGTFSYDEVHSSLRRLENRELVRRIQERPFRWELTGTGRKAITT